MCNFVRCIHYSFTYNHNCYRKDAIFRLDNDSFIVQRKRLAEYAEHKSTCLLIQLEPSTSIEMTYLDFLRSFTTNIYRVLNRHYNSTVLNWHVRSVTYKSARESEDNSEYLPRASPGEEVFPKSPTTESPPSAGRESRSRVHRSAHGGSLTHRAENRMSVDVGGFPGDIRD